MADEGRQRELERIDPTVGALLDQAHADLRVAEEGVRLARAHLERLVRVYLAAGGRAPDGRRVDRDAEGWYLIEPEAADG